MIELDLSYNHLTGSICWLRDQRSRKVSGSEAGYINAKGYRELTYKGKSLKSHRVAWRLYYGQWPMGQIDHINGNRLDNRIANLRDVSPIEQSRNQKLPKSNTSGYPGINYIPKLNKWMSRIGAGNCRQYLGVFDSLLDAVSARKSAESKLNYHKNHGRLS